MDRSTTFLILALVLLSHCFSLLSAAGISKSRRGGALQAAAKENNDLANSAGVNAAPAVDDFLDGGKKKNAHGGRKKHRSSSKNGHKARGGKNAAGTRVGQASRAHEPETAQRSNNLPLTNQPATTERPNKLPFTNQPVIMINDVGAERNDYAGVGFRP